MQSSAPPPSGKAGPSANRRFLGALLIGIGWLIAGLGGLCGVSFLSIGIGDSGAGRYTAMVLVVSSVPIILGATLLLLGRHLRRPAR